jgi:hypothetical protein
MRATEVSLTPSFYRLFSMSRGYGDRRFPKLDVTSSNLVARSFPRLASIRKVTLTRYVDKQGNRVPKGTKGARTIKEKSSKWHSM